MTIPVLAAALVLALAIPLRPRAARLRDGRRPSGEPRNRAAATAIAASRRWRRRTPPAPATVAEWCGDLARALRSGDSLRIALETNVPTDAALREATEPLRLGLERGRTVSEVAGEMSTGRGRDAGRHTTLACSVIAECGRTGGSAAAPLDRVAAALRQRAADDQERAAQAAQAHLSANVLTVLPLAVLAVLLLDGAVRAAVGSPAGLTLVAIGVALNTVGWWWMRRIVDSR